MKNFEKYKTPEEAFTAQVQFCQKQSNDENNCHKNGCKYSTGTTPCIVQWLYDEAEGEKEDSFCEKVEWHKVKKIPMTEEEEREFAERGIDAERRTEKMTNGEKYKTALERAKAMRVFCEKMCDNGIRCAKCPFITSGDAPIHISCIFKWLELEAEEEKEKLLPCPFCGGEAILNSSVESWVECTVCHNRTEMCACDSGAIEKWNRRTNK